jgi:hypothetical protein
MNKRQQLESEIASLQEQLKKLDEQEQGQWVPKRHHDFWFLDLNGGIELDYWEGTQNDKNFLLMGNCFKTKEEAEKYKLRLQSMARKPYLPKEDDWFYTAQPYGFFKVERYIWKKSVKDQELYLLGRVFKTEEEALLWIEKYKGGWKI